MYLRAQRAAPKNIPSYFELGSKFLFWYEKRMRIRDCQSQQRKADFVCFCPADPGWNEGKDSVSDPATALKEFL